MKNRMGKQILAALVLAISLSVLCSQAAVRALEPIQEPIIDGLNHPTAYTLNAGEWVVGGTFLYGIIDRLQIGTVPLLNIILLNAFAKAHVLHLPALRADIGISAGIFTPGPLITRFLPFLAPATAFNVGGVISIKADEKLTLHTGTSVTNASFGGIPLFSMPGPLFLGVDYSLDPAIRLLGSINAFGSELVLGAGIMMRGLYNSTFKLGGLLSYDVKNGQDSPSFNTTANIFWRF